MEMKRQKKPVRQVPEFLPDFVGRARELDILGRELLGSEARVVCITGHPGSGKTSLALAFAARNFAAFPGGVYNLYATPFETLIQTAERDLARHRGVSLIIINDAEIRPQHAVLVEMESLRKAYRDAKVILTSRTSAEPFGVDLNLSLSGLSRSEFAALLEKRFPTAGKTVIANKLYEMFAGHPLGASMAGDILKSGIVTWRELLGRLSPFTRPGLVDPEGREIPEEAPARKQIVSHIVSVSDDFLRKLHNDPKLLYDVSPRRFEEIVAELLHRLNYTITLTPASKDGGKDSGGPKELDRKSGVLSEALRGSRYAASRWGSGAK
jgi:restriction system protein